ncbi:hypothetical protein FC26_GL000816 [Paucilactobacillus vaccinostercus DSM 20634]|uniref:Uncharacterized protein n=1 Tax=Paucilactobacillus vaccinostercus DSM 20634 TaxID=1423813 RepID=A0A0R2A614_9LACO|nr:hypothetical protein [Paucilactobacillus vaccinostercus]KRM62085.1 hypothetical protein FC26_GL000816 [Paucilactobacillus vaccinostercus DSM 20634]
MAVTPGNEQETIISYDKELKQWHYYSDVPEHNHKWDKRVEPTQRVVEPSGRISVLEGTINGTVSVNAKRVSHMTPEQRQAASERMKQLRINSKRQKQSK